MDKAVYDGLYWYLREEKLKHFDQLVGGIRDSLVLDVGAADGSPLTHFLKRHGAEVIALDQDKVTIKDNPNTQVVADALYLPFKPNQFDVVVSEKLIIHSLFNQTNWTNFKRLELNPANQPDFDATQMFLEEVHRVLKPNGAYIGNENKDIFDYLKKIGFQEPQQIISDIYSFARKP